MDTGEDSEYRPNSSNSDNELPHPSEDIAHTPNLPLKRWRQPPIPPGGPPLKRRKGNFNRHYVTLLNSDILDAVGGVIRDDPHFPAHFLPASQLGAVAWSGAEKHAFFSALARLGRDDVPGIASRVRTKSALEVQQFVSLLDEAERRRREDGDKKYRAPRLADVPAAAEIRPELCAALEAAGDSLALRQEAHEEAVEQRRWGAGRWLVDEELARVLELRQRQGREPSQLSSRPSSSHQNTAVEGADASDLPPFAELFLLRNWLRLSERVFMNSSVMPDGNWRGVSEEPPAIRATALADFYSLVLSVTRRLVSTTLYVAGSRVRAQQAGDKRGRTRPIVRAKDVRAAVASVGLPENGREFWARAARRLRLDVYDDDDNEGEEGDDKDRNEKSTAEGDSEYVSGEESGGDMDVDSIPRDDEGEEEANSTSDMEQHEDGPNIMSYDAVEAALGFPTSNLHISNFESDLPPVSDTSSDEITDEDPSEPEPDVDYEHEGEGEDVLMKPSPSDGENEDARSPLEEEAIERDLNEALEYSEIGLNYGGSTRERDALRRRLAIEQRLWMDAERHDAEVSATEEARLWALLGGDNDGTDDRRGPRPDPKPIGRKEGLVDLAGDWRNYTEYYSEWEFAENDVVNKSND
ncbi:hypothetical protein GGS26DRAFT_464023 [Hypomontagnella submonticulosa]|nr:hypothetical protein GGS26DRAFT_464023 [Hypomontagnella submonticulosa]